MIKVNDKVYCYKGYMVFKKDQWYEIFSTILKDGSISHISLLGVKKSYDEFHLFTIKDFKKHFYTQSELRKLKINKLCQEPL